jgi:hypothetical protein
MSRLITVLNVVEVVKFLRAVGLVRLRIILLKLGVS